jgi:hypothetical protein
MNLKENLQDISKSVTSTDSQMRLQKILTDEQNYDSLQSPETQELLKEISGSLAKSLLESKLYHLINSESSLLEDGFIVNRSVLDLKGNFVWSEKNCEKLFKMSLNELKTNSLFGMMAPSSLRYLYSRFSSEILAKKNRVVISYSLTNGAELTSRCTRVVYSREPGNYLVGVMMETRFCRHRIHYFGHGVPLSPIYGSDVLLFTPIQITPSSVQHHLLDNQVDLENLRITPFLKADSPYKKRKIEECFINEF